MRVENRSMPICLLMAMLWSLHICLSEAAEFTITSDKIPSGLWHNFSHVTEKAFPAELSITVVMARISGILVYSYDFLGNQLIVDLDGGNRPTIMVRFRSNNGGPIVNIAQLCSCRRARCLLEQLKFEIRIGSLLSLSCNGGLQTNLQFSKTMDINKQFPVVSFPKSSSTNQATLWIGNHQKIGESSVSDLQMTGCVLDVSYRGQKINMTPFGKAQRGCVRSCAMVGVCNGGDCVETYNSKEERCDCSATVSSGAYCNESSLLQNKNYTFKANIRGLKLSWKDKPTWEFEMIRGNSNISLYNSGSNFICELNREHKITSKNQPNIVIMEFKNEFVNLTMLPQKTYHQIRATVKVTETGLTYMAASSSSDHLYVGYKSQLTNNWEKLPESLSIQPSKKSFNSPEVNKPSGDRVAGKSETTLQGRLDRNLIILVILFIAFIVIIIIVSILLCCNPRRQRNTNTTEADIPLRPIEDPPATVTPATCPRVTDPHQMSTNPEAEPLYQPQISTGNDEQMALSTLPSMGQHGNGNG